MKADEACLPDPAAKKKARHAEYMRKWREQRRDLTAAGAELPHGTCDGYGNWGCRCDQCTKAYSAKTCERLRRNPATQYLNRGLGITAPNRNKEWTGPELELITSRKPNGEYMRSAADLAEALGRSRRAVSRMRHRCRHDPKYGLVVGEGDNS